MEKLKKCERFEDLDDAINQYNELYQAYETECYMHSLDESIVDSERKRADKAEGKLNAIQSIVKL